MSLHDKIVNRRLERALRFDEMRITGDSSSKPHRFMSHVAIEILKSEVTIQWRRDHDHDIATEVEKHEWD